MKNTSKKIKCKQSDNTIEKIGTLKRVPENVSYLTSGINKKLPLIDINIFWNNSIQHLTITNYQPSVYYRYYVMTTSYSNTMQKLQKKQARKLYELLDPINNKKDNLSFLDVGCGDGSFLKNAKEYFENVMGIEPSYDFIKIAREKGLEVINDYVQSGRKITDKKFDAFVSRQVFEHLDVAEDVLYGIKEMLKPGAVGLIEVPNGYKALRNGNFYEFFPDHVNYYSVNSLVSLASKVGLNVISCGESFGGDYLELWLRYDTDIYNWVDNMNIKRCNACKSLADWLIHNKDVAEVAVWGVGAKGICTIMLKPDLFSKYIAFAIDSDPNKKGKYIPNTNIKICDPTRLLDSNVTHVFITAISYIDEIAHEIRNIIKREVVVCTFDKDGMVVEV